MKPDNMLGLIFMKAVVTGKGCNIFRIFLFSTHLLWSGFDSSLHNLAQRELSERAFASGVPFKPILLNAVSHAGSTSPSLSSTAKLAQ